MKPLLVLITASILASLILKFISKSNNLALSARIGMTVMLIFTAMGHIMFADGMSMMIPEFIPFKKELVYLTAVIEVGGAIGLHISSIRKVTAWLVILFFLMILPANIKASMENIDYQSGTYDGLGLGYLWFRIPLQFLFIVWVYVSSIKNKALT